MTTTVLADNTVKIPDAIARLMGLFDVAIAVDNVVALSVVQFLQLPFLGSMALAIIARERRSFGANMTFSWTDAFMK